MKAYINKCGYTIGKYGCSNEYFNAVTINGDKVVAFTFSGMYGAESRVAEALRNRGFDIGWLPLTTYGKLTRKDINHHVHSEHVTIANLDEILVRGYLELNPEYRKKERLGKLIKG